MGNNSLENLYYTINVDALIQAIHGDISEARITLDRVDKYRRLNMSPFFDEDDRRETNGRV